ncbi:MAG: glycosyltransferase [Solirubrobacterales bacterium]
MTPPTRPLVSVVVPFVGERAATELLAANLRRFTLQPGDEMIVADNTGHGITPDALAPSVRVVRATAERSAYHARNAGAGAARNEWVLFLDADCRPVPDLLDEYFAQPPPEGCGALAGTVVGNPRQDALIARYARARGFLNLAGGGEGPNWRIAVGGNVLVRRAAFEQAGGFVEGIRSGGDVDFSRRLQRAGWTIERRDSALVEHRHRDRLLPFLATIARYAAGSRWLNRRYPGYSPRWPLTKQLALSARDAAVLTVRGDRKEALFRVLDGLGLVAHNVGYLAGNSAGAKGQLTPK